MVFERIFLSYKSFVCQSTLHEPRTLSRSSSINSGRKSTSSEWSYFHAQKIKHLSFIGSSKSEEWACSKSPQFRYLTGDVFLVEEVEAAGDILFVLFLSIVLHSLG